MSEEKTTLWKLQRDLAEEIRERAKELRDSRYPDDLLHEMADSAVPIYNSDRVECLLSDLSLAESEDSGLTEGMTSIFAILGVNIFEQLLQTAHETWEEIKEEGIPVTVTDTVRKLESEVEADEVDDFIENLKKELAQHMATLPEFKLVKSDCDAKVFYKDEELGEINFLDECDVTVIFRELPEDLQNEIIDLLVEYIGDNDLIERDDE